MRIGIDARMFGPGFGLGRYVQQLVTQLEQTDHENEYVIFLLSKNWDLWEPKAENFKKVRVDIPWYTLKEQLFLSSHIKREGIDLMHFPHWNIPLMYNKPFVVTIHDLIMFHYPRPEATTHGKLKFWIKDKVHRLVIKSSVKRAKHIISVSDFTKQDIIETLKIKPEKITTIYQTPFSSEHWAPTDRSVLKKYNIDKDYIIYVGAAYPHKNLDNLLRAWRILEEKYDDDCQLVLVGADNYFYKRLRETKEFKACKNVIHTGFVSDEELVSLYSWANLYVLPSLYEGFGLPPFEAIFHDVPVVSSNATCLPEVLGEAALYFDPERPEHMASVIRSALINKDIQMFLLENGRARRAELSGRGFVGKTLGVYEDVRK